MGDIIKEYSLLQMKLEKDDIINCYFKHPECHYERNLYCGEMDLKPDVNWFVKSNKQGKCSYTEFACYVFDYIYTLLITSNLTLEHDCLLSAVCAPPLTIYAVLIRIVSDDLEERLFKMKLEWDGTNLDKMCFTIL